MSLPKFDPGTSRIQIRIVTARANLFGPISSVPLLKTREGIAGIIATNFTSQTVSLQVRKAVVSTDCKGLAELMTKNFVSQLNVDTHTRTQSC
jgi:hypothetical protein